MAPRPERANHDCSSGLVAESRKYGSPMVAVKSPKMWSSGQSPHLGRAPDNNDPNLNRYPLTSYGGGLRVNLFNLAILRWDYAIPLSTGRKPNWTFSLGASY